MVSGSSYVRIQGFFDRTQGATIIWESFGSNGNDSI